jgi:hypothetical protein
MCTGQQQQVSVCYRPCCIQFCCCICAWLCVASGSCYISQLYTMATPFTSYCMLLVLLLLLALL